MSSRQLLTRRVRTSCGPILRGPSALPLQHKRGCLPLRQRNILIVTAAAVEGDAITNSAEQPSPSAEAAQPATPDAAAAKPTKPKMYRKLPVDAQGRPIIKVASSAKITGLAATIATNLRTSPQVLVCGLDSGNMSKALRCAALAETMLGSRGGLSLAVQMMETDPLGSTASGSFCLAAFQLPSRLEGTGAPVLEVDKLLGAAEGLRPLFDALSQPSRSALLRVGADRAGWEITGKLGMALLQAVKKTEGGAVPSNFCIVPLREVVETAGLPQAGASYLVLALASGANPTSLQASK